MTEINGIFGLWQQAHEEHGNLFTVAYFLVLVSLAFDWSITGSPLGTSPAGGFLVLMALVLFGTAMYRTWQTDVETTENGQ